MEHSIPWIEKYRPTDISSIIFDKQLENQINVILSDPKNIHLIITGLPGIGKTTTVRCIAKKILNLDINQGYLELNAAEDRGIKNIANIIPSFCRKIVTFDKPKIILLDEADNMTFKCQYDINEMIKKYGKKTKFIFTCNESSKIIEDIQSVCRIIKFKKLTLNQINKYLIKICESEKIPYQGSGLDIICYISDGDMRKAINNLQLVAFTYNKITKKNVLAICKLPDPKDIESIITSCLNLNLIEAGNKMDEIICQGYYYLDIISGFVYVLSQMDIPNKIMLIDIVNQTKIHIITGVRSKLQLMAMLSRIISFNLKIQSCNDQ